MLLIGNVTAIAGSSTGSVDGAFVDAKFQYPTDIAIVDVEMKTFVMDWMNHRIRIIDAALGS